MQTLRCIYICVNSIIWDTNWLFSHASYCCTKHQIKEKQLCFFFFPQLFLSCWWILLVLLLLHILGSFFTHRWIHNACFVLILSDDTINRRVLCLEGPDHWKLWLGVIKVVNRQRMDPRKYASSFQCSKQEWKYRILCIIWPPPSSAKIYVEGYLFI